MGASIVVNFALNIIIIVLFNAGMGMSNFSSSDPLRPIYNIYLASLFIIPICVYQLVKLISSMVAKNVIVFLSFTYFIWGYVLLDYLIYILGLR